MRNDVCDRLPIANTTNAQQIRFTSICFTHDFGEFVYVCSCRTRGTGKVMVLKGEGNAFTTAVQMPSFRPLSHFGTSLSAHQLAVVRQLVYVHALHLLE